MRGYSACRPLWGWSLALSLRFLFSQHFKNNFSNIIITISIINAITIKITHLSQGRQGDPKAQIQDSARCHSNRSAIGACRRRLRKAFLPSCILCISWVIFVHIHPDPIMYLCHCGRQKSSFFSSFLDLASIQISPYFCYGELAVLGCTLCLCYTSTMVCVDR